MIFLQANHNDRRNVVVAAATVAASSSLMSSSSSTTATATATATPTTTTSTTTPSAVDKKPAQCETCNKIFASQFAFDRHVMSVHNNIRKADIHRMPQCASRRLKTHTSFHCTGRHSMNVKPSCRHLKCSMCDYSTSRRAHLLKHEKSVHLKVKDHACHLCGFRTSVKGSLDRHIR